jgi:signal transduction histidine kinase
MKMPLILTTALLVALIAALAGGTLLLLRRIHDRAAQEAAAETVIQRGRTMVSHLLSQTPDENVTPDPDWAGFSAFVRNLHAVEKGLQYVSVMRDGIVVFNEQTYMPGNPESAPRETGPAVEVAMRRELLQAGDRQVPVVVFAATAGSNRNLRVEVALRKEIVAREGHTAGTAISSMFRLSLLTVCVAFGLCILLVVRMMRREMRHEALRTEQEHLAFSGMLANGIVHDFRNPMSSLKLDIQMLQREVEKGAESRPVRLTELATRIRQTLDRMDDVFKAFLFASRPDSAERTRVDLAVCVQEAVDTLASRLERDNIRTDIQSPDTPVMVNVFAASLRRALVNILTNAIAFSPTGGAVITIRVSSTGGGVTIEIADQGPGIPPANRKRVFEMFMTTRPEGTGLGLFLAKAAIERSGGTISVADTPPGSGACIRLNLPAA